MGTPALIHVLYGINEEETKTICSIYSSCNGYPTGIGQIVADFTKNCKIINGNGLGYAKLVTHANGMGCFAAQLVAHLKESVGNIYMDFPTKSLDTYTYYIYEPEVGKAPTIKCYYLDTKIFDGEARDFSGEKIEITLTNNNTDDKI